MGLAAYNPWRTTARPMPKNRLAVMGPPLLYPPALGNLAAWYDAKDLASMVMDSANRVSLWADKSGNSGVKGLVLNGVSANGAYSVDNAAFDILGDIDIRIHVALNDWTPAAINVLFAKSNVDPNRSWILEVSATTGLLAFTWNPAGTVAGQIVATSSVAPTVADFAAIWIRVTLDVDNGAAGNTVTFYTSSDGTTWTQLGTPVITAGVTSIANSNANLEVGARQGMTTSPMSGIIYRAQVYNGINGTKVWDADFTSASKLATSIVDASATGATITIGTTGATGARISGARDLYQGTVANQPIYLPWSEVNYGYNPGVSGAGFTAAQRTISTTPVSERLEVACSTFVAFTGSGYALTGNDSTHQNLQVNAARYLIFNRYDTTAAAFRTATSSAIIPTNALAVACAWDGATTVNFYYSVTSDLATASWVALGVAKTITAISTVRDVWRATVGNTAAALSGIAGLGKITAALFYRSGVVLDGFDASRYTSGSTFTAATGEVWTVSGGAHIVTRTGLYYDGSNDYLKTAAFSLSQPVSVYMVGDQVSYTVDDAFYDGATDVSMLLRQHTVSGQINMYAGTQAGVNSWAIKTAAIVAAVFNGGSSFNKVNRAAGTTPANAGTNTPNGLCVGSKGAAGSPGNIVVSENAVYAVAHAAVTQDRVALYAGRKWRFSV